MLRNYKKKKNHYQQPAVQRIDSFPQRRQIEQGRGAARQSFNAPPRIAFTSQVERGLGSEESLHCLKECLTKEGLAKLVQLSMTTVTRLYSSSAYGDSPSSDPAPPAPPPPRYSDSPSAPLRGGTRCPRLIVSNYVTPRWRSADGTASVYESP
ncbi:hypothetical protein INR49_023750 [Caranx melampygus]|nr:hypothetical protein INR49_023750 [Caranx melampygus]